MLKGFKRKKKKLVKKKDLIDEDKLDNDLFKFKIDKKKYKKIVGGKVKL